MIEYKQGVAARLPVRLLDSSGVPVVGVGSGAVAMTLMYSDGTFATVTISGGNWAELSSGQFTGTGTYTVVVPLGQINMAGVLMYSVTAAGAEPFINYVKIVANEEVDTFNVVSPNLQRALGMLHDNSVLDSTTFDVNNNLTAGRLRIYDSAAHALAAGVTGLLFQYAIQATYLGTNCQTYTVTRVI